MGNHSSCQIAREGILDPYQCTVSCKRACGAVDGFEGDLSCDPAGVVFDDTIRHLGQLEQLAFRFAGSSNLSALRWVFVFGARFETCDSNGTTLLHTACRTGSLPIVKDLVRRGKNVDVTDIAGWTPLHVAVCMGRQDVALYLLQCGAMPHVMNMRGQMPEDICSHKDTKDVVNMFDPRVAAKPALAAGFPVRGMDEIEGLLGPPCSGEPVHSLQFEPFFVPREPAVQTGLRQEELKLLGLEFFNRSPGHGVAFLVAAGIVRDYPVEINTFLSSTGADPVGIGEFLSEEFPIAQTLRLEFLNSLPLLGTGVVAALHVAFTGMAVPHDLLKVDRLCRGVAHFWWKQHEEKSGDKEVMVHSTARRAEVSGLDLLQSILSTDTLQRLLFSTLMLHRWLKAGKKMSLNQWIELNTGIEGLGNDVPVHVQSHIYTSVVQDLAALITTRRPMQWGSVEMELSSWVQVQYKCRAQVGGGTIRAAWPQASPRTLAEEGGVTSAGCSLPMPSQAVIQDSEPRTVQQLSRGQHGEAAWVTVTCMFLFLWNGNGPDAAPYAMVWLKHIMVRSVDLEARRVVLGSRPNKHSLGVPGEDEWMEVVLLLADGRFQPLEAPELVLRFDSTEITKLWADRLEEICVEPAFGKGAALVQKMSSWRANLNLTRNNGDDASEVSTPGHILQERSRASDGAGPPVRPPQSRTNEASRQTPTQVVNERSRASESTHDADTESEASQTYPVQLRGNQVLMDV
mmetsp:Transcript_54459/g.100687  ORF Transcript_54459/g.100687 Transcript_54459/m.100687 type:complete len:740 (+) Transcript_54459:62-2281(+)